jgi:hypothetical protein
MIDYVVLDKITGIVDHVQTWIDNGTIDPNYILVENQEIIRIDDTLLTVVCGDVYNFNTLTFSHPTPVTPITGETEIEALQARCAVLEAAINTLM